MATLYQTSSRTRKFLVAFLIFTIVLLAIETISRLNEQRILNPQDPTRFYMNSNRIFDNIDKPTIPGIEVDSNVKPVYVLESIFNLMPDVAYVYKIEKPREKLQVFENAQAAVSVLGFDPILFTDNGNNAYTWSTAGNTRTIDFNKVEQTWSLKTNYADNIEAKRKKTLGTNPDEYGRAAERLVSRLGFDSTGLNDPQVDVRYAKYENGLFFEKTPESLEGDYVIVNLYRELPFADLKPSKELPEVTNKALIPKPISATVYKSDPRVGQIRMVLSNEVTSFPKDVFELDYVNFEYSSEKGAYLIITPEEAWSYIQQGRGSLVAIYPQGADYFNDFPDKVSIRRFIADRSKTKVAYWEPEEYLGYIYPIYIFEGRAEMEDGRQANFTYFVEAIKRVE